jgi:hypothetical protein
MHEASGSIGGGRVRRALIAAGTAALAAIALSALTARDAQAQEPLDFELNHGVIQMSGLNVDLFETEPATFTGGTIDPATGEFTIPAEGITLPPVRLNILRPFTITLVANGPLTGTFDAATGQVDASLSSRAEVVIELTDPPDPVLTTCTINPIDLEFSTEVTDPFAGVRFTEGLDGPGAVAAAWDSLPPSQGEIPQVCEIVDSFTGAGGVWLSRDIEDPPQPPRPARLVASVSPVRKTVKPGGSARFRVQVENTGELASENVEVCANVPNALGVSAAAKRAQRCRPMSDLAAGETARQAFTVKTKRKTKPKSYNLTFTARGTGQSGAPARAVLKVKKKRR